MVEEEKKVATGEGRSDIDLMLQVRDGNLEAFEELYRRYKRPIFNFFYQLTWNRGFSEDALQEVFLRLYSHAKRYRPVGKFTTYLFQIAKNYWLNEREKRINRPKTFSLEGGMTGPEGEERRREPADPTRGPRTRMMEDEIQLKVRLAIGELPEKLRLVYVLSEYEGMKYEEVGEILDIPVGTVKSRMFKAVKLLQERLERTLPPGSAGK